MTIQVDDSLGRCLSFGEGAKVVVDNSNCSLSEKPSDLRRFAVSCWVKPGYAAYAEHARDYTLFSSESSGRFDSGLAIGVGKTISLYYISYDYETDSHEWTSLDSPEPISLTSWTHIAVSTANDSSGFPSLLNLYVNGELVGTTSVLAVERDTPNTFTLGQSQIFTDNNNRQFIGRAAGFRLYGRSLTEEKIKQDIDADIMKGEVGGTFPIEFHLHNDEDQQVIYLDKPIPQTLFFDVSNVSAENISLPSASDTAGTLNIFELVFRPGTLRNQEGISLVTSTRTDSSIIDDSPNWTMVHFQQADGTDVFQLSRRSDRGGQDAYILTPGESFRLALEGVEAQARGGPRAVRVQLRYYLHNVLGEAIIGHRLHYMAVMNMSPAEIEHSLDSLLKQTESIEASTEQHGTSIVELQKDVNHLAEIIKQAIDLEKAIAERLEAAPLSAGVLGSAAVLNDGVSTNDLTIYIGNQSSHDVEISHEAGFRSKFSIEFDVYESRPWGLATRADLSSFKEPQVEPHGWTVQQVSHNSYTIYPDSSITKLTRGEYVSLKFSGFTCNAPTGNATIIVRYQNIGESDVNGNRQTGHLSLQIQRTPLVPQENARNFTVGAGHFDLVDKPRLGLFHKEYLEASGEPVPDASLSLDNSRNLRIHSGNRLQLDSSGIELNGNIVSKMTVERSVMAKKGVFYDTNPGHLVPEGGIIMWSGAEHTLAALEGSGEWHRCDGSNGTPDLRGKFIVGAGRYKKDPKDGYYYLNEEGGANQVALNVSQMPSHDHFFNDPGHTHESYYIYPYSGGEGEDSKDRRMYSKSSDHWKDTKKSETNITFLPEGGGGAHENRPLFYALIFIMKLHK